MNKFILVVLSLLSFLSYEVFAARDPASSGYVDPVPAASPMVASGAFGDSSCSPSTYPLAPTAVAAGGGAIKRPPEEPEARIEGEKRTQKRPAQSGSTVGGGSGGGGSGAPSQSRGRDDLPMARPSSVGTSSSVHPVVRNQTYKKFAEIMAKGPFHMTPIGPITAEDEIREGSRRWVASFGDKVVEEWHKNAEKLVRNFQSKKGEVLPSYSNVAIARLVFVKGDNSKEERDIPFFFVSGFPANGIRPSISKFAQSLSTKLGDKYKDYGLRFSGKSYNSSGVESFTSTQTYDLFKEKVKTPIETELSKEDRIVREERLKSHLSILSDKDNFILAEFYFHSEQGLWMVVKEEIEKFKKELERNRKADVRGGLGSTLPEFSISRIFLDLCSYYDVCWCCGDTLASVCHTKELGDYEVYVRATGVNEYKDKPFDGKPLRDLKGEFASYMEGGTGFEHTPYKPYVAHAMAGDFN
jgi:hypothetical protein